MKPTPACSPTDNGGFLPKAATAGRRSGASADRRHLKPEPQSICGALPRRRYAGPAVIQEGKVRAYDMGGNDSTLDMAKAIAEKLG
ncbi:MAG: hypothetical protein KIS67_24760 [Verrucomicrobiae bacterium]|nr:hypothetical protein [Verrucomicrobiae bacterium]